MRVVCVVCLLLVSFAPAGCAGREARLMLAVSRSPERLAPEAAVQSGAGLSAFMEHLPTLAVSLVGLSEPVAFAYLAVHDLAQALNIGTAVVGKNDVLYIDARATDRIEVDWAPASLTPSRLVVRQARPESE